MLLPIIVLLFFIALYILYDTTPSINNKRDIRLFCGFCAFLLLQLLRVYCQLSFPDIPNYRQVFCGIKPLYYVLENNGQGLDYYETGEITQIDFGYRIFVSLIKCFTNNYEFFLLIVSVIELISLKLFCNKFDVSPFIIMPIYVAMTYTAFQIGMLRQALAFCLFLAALCQINKKWIFFSLILLGCFFHKSMVFCFLLFWCNAKIKLKYVNIIFIISLIIYLLKIDFVSQYWLILDIEDLNRVNHYLKTGVDSSFLGIGFWERIILYSLMVISFKNLIIRNKTTNSLIVFFNLGICVILLQMFFFASPSITSRLRYYIVIFPMLYLLLYAHYHISKYKIKFMLYLPISMYLLMYMFTQSGYLTEL